MSIAQLSPHTHDLPWLESGVACPSCLRPNMRVFYTPGKMPAHSVMLHHSRKEALEYPRGDMRLGFCEGCGFISNTAFDVQLNEYDSRYEETQGFSPTFKRFNQGVAEALISRYELQGKTVLEIGCGKGEFLALLCEMGVGRGIGFDPAFIPDRLHSDASDRLTFFKELYSEKHSHVAADFICCKMTLEHISDTAAMIQTVRRSIGDRRTPVFFQIPNAEYVLDDLAFWDVYYEHCSYFTAGSLRRLFQSCGFRVLDVRVEYGSQYLTIDAVPDDAAVAPPAQAEEDLADLQSAVQRFAKQVPARIADWQSKLRQFHSANSRVVLWGGGSKAVAFLNALDIQDEVKYAVDVNPFKTGTFLAGTGQEVVAPEFLNEYRPDVIVLMNPIYKSEVETSLKAMGVQAELLTV